MIIKIIFKRICCPKSYMTCVLYHKCVKQLMTMVQSGVVCHSGCGDVDASRAHYMPWMDLSFCHFNNFLVKIVETNIS